MNSVSGTVFIVDDNVQVRTSLARVLSAAGYRTRAFESAECFLKEQDGAEPGCLLLDIYLPGLSGFDLQRTLDGSACARPIVFLTGMADIQTSVAAMKAGAIDFLTKPIDNEKLFIAVNEALRRDAEQRAARAIRSAIEARLSTLTPREREVLKFVVAGRLNKQISAILGTGEKTVKVHRSRVMAKMRVRSVAELVHLVERVGFLGELTISIRSSDLNGNNPQRFPVITAGNEMSLVHAR
ncbi:MAG TPA: response regulator [Steroidobacteraceae bacterium]|jgi:FixJ family two-component response regulator|nr:response regulator [Steroidobacteraceae bacterium]